MVQKATLVQSNYWHRPGIAVNLIQDTNTAPNGAISVSTDFEDVILAILAEIEHPVKHLTRKSQEKAIRAAISTVLEKIKESTVKVM